MTYKKVILDLESNNLLHPMLDYTQKPFKFKPEFTVWCLSLRCIETNQSKLLVRPDILKNLHTYPITPEQEIELSKIKLEPLTKEQLKIDLDNCEEIVAHNGIKFDFPTLKLMDYLDYQIGYPYLESLDNKYKTESTLFNKSVTITDTMIWSKLLNADRFGGHSLKNFGTQSENKKIDFHDFENFSIDMLIYCDQDTSVNRDAYLLLEEEKGGYTKWETPYLMEAKLADLSLNQELFGFAYDQELSEKCKIELDALLKERYDEVTPQLPPRPLNKGEQKYYTPPKVKFSASANRVSSAMTKFIEKVGGDYDPIHNSYLVDGIEYDLYSEECVVKTLPSDIKDLDHLKSYLISLGWIPSQWNVRDLTKDSKKKSLSKEKFIETLDRYIDNTFNGFFKKSRLRELGFKQNITEEDFKKYFIKKYDSDKKVSKSPLRVPTSPPLKVGTTKDLCPNLLSMKGELPFIKAVTEFFTYQHRRNSISGNIDEETGESNSGFESYLRADGRVATPVDTLATNTSRMAHREICNIPRVESVYGGNIRALFGSGKDHLQFGFDFSSLEARIQGHFCIPYTDGVALAETLVAVKPFDIHTVNAEKLGISRGDAKAISYACVTEDTEVFSILNGWIPISKIKPETQKCVSVNTKDMINHYHTDIQKLHTFDDKEVFEVYTDTGSIIKCTADHRWFVLDHDDNKYKYVETTEYFEGDYSVVKSIKGIDKNISYYKFKKMVSIGIQKTYCLTTETSNFYMRQNNFETLTGNCLYGASPGKLCKMLSLTEEEGEKLYKDYWDALPALKELKEKVESYWESTGNSYILGIDGRKLMARSKHSLLNLLFQGGGSIAVKYSLVLAAQKMDEENILGDVFLDDHETSLHKVYQMIMYHK